MNRSDAAKKRVADRKALDPDIMKKIGSVGGKAPRKKIK